MTLPFVDSFFAVFTSNRKETTMSFGLLTIIEHFFILLSGEKEAFSTRRFAQSDSRVKLEARFPIKFKAENDERLKFKLFVEISFFDDQFPRSIKSCRSVCVCPVNLMRKVFVVVWD